ncbi:hypothetical protein [Schumannella soli]|uniref:Cell division protein FtsL n=1 Tax=Schumannella soli TaxID=2590779 RepID=A0A506Y7Q3_9MICO|nr:hypothetical protein [Schumannella soli]TPW76389.1 hypothetical protein FJ657_11485 [Schumannella soli]
MSNLAVAAARPRERSGEEQREQRPHLEIAPSRAQKRARPRVVYALAVIAGIGVILIAQLLMSIVTADGAYQIASLQTKQNQLGQERKALNEKLEVLGSTQNLTQNAEALGMVASGNPVFLDVASGRVSGTATPDGGSITGGGNLIGNSLLTGSTKVDPAAIAAARAAADAAAAGQQSEDPTQGFDGSVTTGGDPDSGASGTGTGSGDVASGAENVIPAPTTR